MSSSNQNHPWEVDSHQAFEAWIKSMEGRGISKKAKSDSTQIYRYRWGHFDRFLREQGLNIFQIDAQHMERFLYQKARMLRDPQGIYVQDELNQFEQLRRYQQLIEKVYEFVIDSVPEKISKNPADLRELDGKSWSKAEKKELRDFLSVPELEVLETYLEFIAQQHPESLRTLIEVRNFRPYVTTALMIGAGLKSSEVLTMTIANVHLRAGRITLQREDSSFRRQISLESGTYLFKLLETWITHWHTYL